MGLSAAVIHFNETQKYKKINLHFGAFAAVIRLLPTDQFFHKQHQCSEKKTCFSFIVSSWAIAGVLTTLLCNLHTLSCSRLAVLVEHTII